MRKIFILAVLSVLISTLNAQSNIENYSSVLEQKYPRAQKISKSGNSYELMELRSYLGALNSLIKKTQNESYVAMQIELVDNLIATAQVTENISENTYSKKDEYLGWIVTKANARNKSTEFKEVPLFESYSFFYIAEFLYVLQENDWINKSMQNRIWWEEKLHFVEKHIWTKWRERSKKVYGKYNTYFLRSRTHMGSHWAGIAMYLNKMTKNHNIFLQTEELVRSYDLLLKRNLHLINGSYVWNSTYDNVDGTDAISNKISIIQDGSHGNHVISYIVAAYELSNPNWTEKDLKRFANTLTKKMFNSKINSFADKVDGTADLDRPGWGNNVGDGWAKLTEYDKKASKTLLRFSKDETVIKKHGQELQFKANFRK